MDGSALQILHLLLSLFQVLALGSPNAIITILQHISVGLVFGIFEYSSLEYPRHAYFRRSKIPNLWRLFLFLVCLASLISLGSSNSIICLFRTLFSWLLAGIGGMDAWTFDCPKEFRVRKIAGSESSDRLGWKHSQEEKEAYNTLCDQHQLLKAQKLLVHRRDVTISVLDDLIEKQDQKNCRLELIVQKRDATIDALKAELEQRRRHRCWNSSIRPDAIGSLSSNNLLRKISQLETSLESSKAATAILHERLQNSRPKAEQPPPEVQRSYHLPQQAQIASANFQIPSFPPQNLSGFANPFDSFACYQAHTVSGHGLSSLNLPPMVTGLASTSNAIQQAQRPSALPHLPEQLPEKSPACAETSFQPQEAQIPSESQPLPAPVTNKPSASTKTVENPSQSQPSQSEVTAPSIPVRKVKAFKNRLGRDLRCDNDDLDDLEFDASYIPPPIIRFTCICKGIDEADVQLPADCTFGNLATSWSGQRRAAMKGRKLVRIEYGEHMMELDLTAQIQSNALILAEEKATVHMTLED
ncbi:hypothetical protein FKW77_009506 [Venturia effusa]|uniref:Uncharacterized protein n=1 Tax=Venturia effusa TaxID=50376 RepID=A0A517LD17_9PEZI|nr:hypothetical protein FKW77_009506 [Venturia effusa]